jgi:hypothetical protein
MKLKVVIVDFEMSPRSKRLAIRLGIPALILGMATVAYAGPLVTFAAGGTLHAADLNSNFTNLQTQITALQTAETADATNITALQTTGAPRYAGIVWNNSAIIDPLKSASVSTALTVTHSSTGNYIVNYDCTDFPNGVVPVVTSALLGNPVYSDGLTTTSPCGVYVQTKTAAGVAADGPFSVFIIGQ